MGPLAKFAFFRLVRFRLGRDETRHRLAVLGNDDLRPLRRLFHKAGKMGLCFVKVHLPHHGATIGGLVKLVKLSWST